LRNIIWGKPTMHAECTSPKSDKYFERAPPQALLYNRRTGLQGRNLLSIFATPDLPAPQTAPPKVRSK